MKATLRTDEVSLGKDKKVYGKKGDDVTIVNQRGHVVIAMDNRGNKFPVLKENLEIKKA